MNKIEAIEWLAGYMNPPDAQDEDAGHMVSDLNIELAEAKALIEECEVRMIKMFDTWKDDIALEELENEAENEQK